MVNVLAQQLCTDAQVDVAVDWESRGPPDGPAGKGKHPQIRSGFFLVRTLVSGSRGLKCCVPWLGGIHDLADPLRKPHQEEAQGLGRLLRTLKPLPVREDASLLGKPRGLTQPQAQPHKPTCVLWSRHPRAVLGMDCVSSWGHRLLSPEIRYLPPTLHPAVSRELSSLSSPSCSPDPGSSLGDGKGSFPACGPDAMWYAFLFFQHVVKLITLGNDFLTVLGKEKEGGKKRPLKKNEPWR